eukprot:gene42212-56069_t
MTSFIAPHRNAVKIAHDPDLAHAPAPEHDNPDREIPDPANANATAAHQIAPNLKLNL